MITTCTNIHSIMHMYLYYFVSKLNSIIAFHSINNALNLTLHYYKVQINKTYIA
uniref:Uncharacterized protein n=1 Tax=Anguilla anguilla TaxID=7936 RepID=A0A0E9SUG7_ANGAN